jgi:4-amino-4-deoxy-L-arabinose transferase-like glycosyltransferase
MTQAPHSVISAAGPSSSPQPGLLAWIAGRPDAAFGAFLALHFVVWTALPALLYANLPLDLIEALTYGPEWVLGSDKLPPLPWWLVEIMYRLFGADIAYYALAEAVVVIAFVLVWKTARPLVGATGALISVLIIDGLHYFQYTAAKFNHDVIQLPFWALAGWSFHAALRRGHIGHWLLLGIAFAGALWAKYFVVVIAGSYAMFLLFDGEARPALRTPGPWLAAGVALLLTAPHLIWLVQNDFLPFHYVDARAAPARGFFDHILHPLEFAAGQIFFMLPLLVITAMWVWPRSAAGVPFLSVESGWGWGPRSSVPVTTTTAPPGEYGADDFDRRIVTVLAFGPVAAMLVLIGISGRGTITMWGYPLWLFLGLWIVLCVPRTLDARRLRRIVSTWAAVFVLLALVFTADYTVLPMLDHRYRNAFFPGDALAADLTQRFHDATGGKRLSYVIGSMWIGGNVAHYSPDHPEVLIDGLPPRAPWIDLDDLRAKGAILVWEIGDLDHLPPAFAAVAPSAQIGAPFTLPPRRHFGTRPETFNWAILMPQ